MKYGSISSSNENLPVLFSVDLDNMQVLIGDYYNSGGVLWDTSTKQLYVKGTGMFQGTLDTLTIKTTKGDGITSYPAGDISNAKLLLDFIYTYTQNPNESVALPSAWECW